MKLVSPGSSYNSVTNIHCKTTIPVAIHNVTWAIENFSCCQERNGEKMESSIFYAGDKRQKWILEIFPNGFNASRNGFVSFFITSLNNSSITVKYVISILNHKKEKYSSFSKKHTFQRAGEREGACCLISLSELFDEGESLLPNDCLTISCELNIAGEIVNKKSSYCYTSLQNNLSQDLMNLFNSSELSDITISIRDKKFKAHKAVLAARSPVFSAMFKHEMKEKNSNIISIDDIEPIVMEEVLRYIYSGKCNRLGEMAEDIVRVADKYNIEDLKEECEEFLCSFLTLENALPNLVIADMHNLQRLKIKANHLLGPINAHISPEFTQWFYNQKHYNVQNENRYIKGFLSLMVPISVKAIVLEMFYNALHYITSNGSSSGKLL